MYDTTVSNELPSKIQAQPTEWPWMSVHPREEKPYILHNEVAEVRDLSLTLFASSLSPSDWPLSA
jgi:hypothetical protein